MVLGLIILVLALIGAVAVVAMIAWLVKSRNRKTETAHPAQVGVPSPMPAVTTALPVPAPEPARPTQIVVSDGDNLVLGLTALDQKKADQRLKTAKRVDAAMFGRALEPIMQVAPSMATAGMAANRQLMEVVINGPLVAAKGVDGGFRAMTMGPGGVQQNAVLFKPEALQNIANAAMVWQLASVIVAQKHLADISATLKRLEQKVAGVQSMLEESRAALIQSAMSYVATARRTMQNGEFLERTRDKLEDFEIQLEQAGFALLKQIRRETAGELERDTVGCEGEYQSALRKHQGLSARVNELVACAEVRLANWYLCSLYPDRSRMLEGRMEQIQAFIDDVHKLRGELGDAVEADCRLIDSSFTTDDTIAERRSHVRREAEGPKALGQGTERCEAIIERIEMVATDRATPVRLLVEIEQGVAKGVYLSQERPKIAKLRIQEKVAASH